MGLNFLPDRFRAVFQIDGVVVALAHLPAVRTRHLGGLGEKLQRLREDSALLVPGIHEVETSHDLPGQFKVGQLVDADRNIVGPVDDDVGGLKKGVAQEPVGGQVLVGHLLPDLLVGRHPFQPGQRGDHGQEDQELGVFQDRGLQKKGATVSGSSPTLSQSLTISSVYSASVPGSSYMVERACQSATK